MARDLIVRIIGDDKSLQAALIRDQKAVATFGNTTTSGLARVDSAFARTQRIAAGGFIGGAVAAAGITAIKSFVDAASESQKILGQTQFALEQTGKSWDTYGKQIERAVTSQSKLGFDDEALLQTFTQFLRVTGDVNRALADNALAMDIARGAHIDLDRAAQVVNKAELGMAGAIRRLGIDTKGATTSTELLARLQQQFGGAAVAAGKDASTAMDRLQVSTENLKETLGGALLPAVTTLADALSDAATTADLLASGLRQLGDVKIPEIRIPIVGDFGGSTLGTSKFVEGFKKGLRDQIEGPAVVIGKQLAKVFGDGVDKGTQEATPDLAAQFETSINTMFRSAFSQATSSGAALTPALEFDKLPGVRTAADDIGKNIRAAIAAAQGKVADAIEKGTKAVAADKAAKAQEAAQAEAEKQAKKRRGAFARLIATLQLGVDRSLLTKSLGNDLAPLEALKAGLEKQIRAGVDVQAAQAQLVQVTGQIAAKQEEIRQQAADALQGKQFRALGLSSSGDELVPGIDNLSKRLKGALGKIASGDLDVGSKLASRLKAAQKLIRTEGSKLTEETRKQIDAFLKAATGQDSKAAAGLDKTLERRIQLTEKTLKALGFGVEKVPAFPKVTAAALGAAPRLPVASSTARSSGGINISGPITVVADNPDAFLRELQKKAGRTSATARGRYAGRSLGLG